MRLNLLLGLMALVSCGIQPPTPSTTRVLSTDRGALVLIMNGFLSCNPGSRPSQIATVAASWSAVSQVEQRYPATTIVYSCFAAEVDKVLVSLYPATGGGLKEVDVPRNEFSAFLATQIEADSDLFIYAYSYGGDLLAQMVDQFPPWLKQMKALVTVDLIGADQCPPHVFGLGVATISPRQGCLQAPARAAFDVLAQSPVPWQNLYQKAGYFIRSGPIPSSDAQRSPENTLVDFSGWSSWLDAHAKIRDDARTWDVIEALFVAGLPQ